MPRGIHWCSMRNRYVCKLTAYNGQDNTVRSLTTLFGWMSFFVCVLFDENCFWLIWFPFFHSVANTSETIWNHLSCPFHGRFLRIGYRFSYWRGVFKISPWDPCVFHTKQEGKFSIGKHQLLKNKFVLVQTIDVGQIMIKWNTAAFFVWCGLANADCFHLNYMGRSSISNKVTLTICANKQQWNARHRYRLAGQSTIRLKCKSWRWPHFLWNDSFMIFVSGKIGQSHTPLSLK